MPPQIAALVLAGRIDPCLVGKAPERRAQFKAEGIRTDDGPGSDRRCTLGQRPCRFTECLASRRPGSTAPTSRSWRAQRQLDAERRSRQRTSASIETAPAASGS